jgi:CrcB protein
MSHLIVYLFVAVGGAIGACLRYFLMTHTHVLLGKDFPYGTLLVNVVGSFFIGALYAWVNQQMDMQEHVRAFLVVGILGSLTTFSTFSLDTITLVQTAQWFKAGVNIMLNVACCLCVTWIALQLFKG